MQSDLIAGPVVEPGEYSKDFRPAGPVWFAVDVRGDVAYVRIAGEIGIAGSLVENCIAQIGDAPRVEITINSIGGDCDAAFKLYDALQGREVNIEIFGACYSAAVVIALAGKKIRIEKNAGMMIHCPRQFVFGNLDELLLEAIRVERCKFRQHALLTRRVPAVLADKWLDGRDYYFTAAQALELDLADEIFSAPSPVQSASALDVPPLEQTADEILFLDFLRAFGRFKVADKQKFFRNVNAWLVHHTM